MDRVLSVKFSGGKRVDVEFGETVVRTDQSPENGGEGSAPEPFQHFLASIAACAGIYALEFCTNRAISTEGMELRMVCERNQKLKRYTKMSLELTLPLGFPEKFRPAIVRAMNLCAVKRHIVDPPEFEIQTLPSSV